MALASAEFQEQYGLQVLARELNESAILQQAPDGGLRVAAMVGPERGYDAREGVARHAATACEAGEAVVVIATQDRIEAVAPIDRNAGIYLYNVRNPTSSRSANGARAIGPPDL